MLCPSSRPPSFRWEICFDWNWYSLISFTSFSLATFSFSLCFQKFNIELFGVNIFGIILLSILSLLSLLILYVYVFCCFSVFSVGVGNGNPLQNSCLENPMQSMGSLRVGHNWATSLSLFTFMHWRRKWQPTPVFLPGESQGRGSLVGCHLWGHTESDTTDAT